MIKLSPRLFFSEVLAYCGYVNSDGELTQVCTFCHNKRGVLYARERSWRGKPYSSYLTLPCRYCRYKEYREVAPVNPRYTFTKVGPHEVVQGELMLGKNGEYIPNPRVRRS